MLLVAARSATVPTPFGVLGLDPAAMLYLNQTPIGTDRLQQTAGAIPNDARLVGLQLWFQGATQTSRPGLRLSGVLSLQIAN